MRLTRAGKAAAALSGLLWAAAFATGSRAAAAGGFVLTLVLAIAVGSLRAPRVDVEQRLARTVAVDGDRLRETLVLTSRSRGRVRAVVRETATPGLRGVAGPADVTLRRGAPHAIDLDWDAVSWGRQKLGPVRIVVRDPWGLLEMESRADVETPLRVQPKATRVGKYSARGGNPEPALGAYTVSRPGDGSEFFGLREYRAGDSIRRINWKASARTGATIVNQVTRDSFARVVVLVDAREKELLGSSPAFARNGRAAASILQHHDRARDHVSLLVLTDEARNPSIATNPRFADLLDALGDVTPGGWGDTEAAVRRHLTLFRPRSPVYLVTSGAFDPKLGDAIRVISALGSRVTIISPVPEGVADEAADDAARTRRDALQLAGQLGAHVVHWPSSRSLEVVLAAS